MAKRQATSNAPDAGAILGLYQSRLNEGDESTLRSRARTTRDLTEMRHAVTIPAEYRAIAKEIRTPFVRDTWQRVAAALTRDTPVAHVEGRDGTANVASAANIAERFHLALIAGMSRERGENLLWEDAKALVRDQEAVIKCVHKPDAWANFPRRTKTDTAEGYQSRVEGYKKASSLIFAARVVDRLSMLFGDGEYGDDWALEYGEYPTDWLGSRFGMMAEDGDGTGYYYEGDGTSKTLRKRPRLVDPNVSPEHMLGGRPFPEGELATGGAGMSVKVEYWDADWWCVVVDGSMAPDFPKKNPYSPRLPYFRAKSDPVLYALSFLVPGFDSLLTMWLNWAYLGAYPIPQLVAPSNAAPNIGDVGGDLEPVGGDSTKPMVWQPGRMYEAPPGYELKFTQPPPIGQDVQQMAQIYRQLIETAGVASVLRGAAGSDYSGYLANQLLAAATLTYKHLGTAMENQLAEMGEFIWHVVSTRIKQEVYVLATEKDGKNEAKHWLGLKPSGRVTGLCAPVDMLARMEVKLRPVLPTDEQARAMIAMQLTNAQKPLLSRKRAIEKHLQEEDPEGVLNEIATEDALEQEPFKTLIMTEALRKAGYLPSAQSGLLDAQGQPMPSAGGGPGLPGLPGQAAAGMPAIPGLNQPLQPGPPGSNGIPAGTGGRAPGSYPGMPNNQGPTQF